MSAILRSDRTPSMRRAFRRAGVRRIDVPEPEVRRGRHQLTRYEDGLERCIGCEVCADVCPARCIIVRGEDNAADDPRTPQRRYAYQFEVDYSRCVQCNLCVESCPTSALVETGITQMAFAGRAEAVMDKTALLIDRQTVSPVSAWLVATTAATARPNNEEPT